MCVCARVRLHSHVCTGIMLWGAVPWTMKMSKTIINFWLPSHSKGKTCDRALLPSFHNVCVAFFANFMFSLCLSLLV